MQTRFIVEPRDLERMLPEQNIPFVADKMIFYAGLIKVFDAPVLQLGDLALCETLVRRIDILPDDHPLKVEYKGKVDDALLRMRRYFGGSIEQLLEQEYVA